MAQLIVEQHEPGTLTLAIVNTVERAQSLYQELSKSLNKRLPEVEKVLVHSRLREEDRNKKWTRIVAPLGKAGRVVVASQAVEAGVDISARTLITELAPWASMVQRFGRCNRAGEDAQGDILWVDVGGDSAPYEAGDIEGARSTMRSMKGASVGPSDLENLVGAVGDADYLTVIRRRDVVGLFDTAPELTGSYLDVSQYVRGKDERDVSVLWRDISAGGPDDKSKARHSETVSVPLGSKGLGDFLRRGNNRSAWSWDFLDSEWTQIQPRDIHPGMVLMLDADQGGYSQDIGWIASSNDRVEPVSIPEDREPDGQDSEPTNTLQREWVTLSEHSRHVEAEANAILGALSLQITDPDISRAVAQAALYHDSGKAHPAFQEMLRAEGECPYDEGIPLAKSRGNGKMGPQRRHFRHEFGSALAVLEHADLPDGEMRDLAAYLAAAHHGKLRLGIRSLPGQRADSKDSNPDPDRLVGYRVSEPPETLPSVDLGEGLVVPKTTLDTSIARMGVDKNGCRSWLERSLALLERFGPFRLAYLEAIVRAADMRASKAEQKAAE